MRRTGSTISTLALALFAGLSLSMAAYADEADEQRARGKLLFEETAGDVGCAACHGPTGQGDPDTMAPNIRGASKAMLDSALGGGVPLMEFMTLTPQEKTDVISYLAYLRFTEQVLMDPIAAKGKQIFDETAGGVGCQSCHGDTGEGLVGPNIRGKDTTTILDQLRTNEKMQFIELSPDDVDSVAIYLRYLHDLEAH